MTDRRIFILAHPEARRRAIAAVAEAPAGHVVTVREPTRNTAQNALLHSLLSEVSRQAEWANRKWDIEDWKRLMVAAWMRVRKEQAIVLPALDGHGVDVLYRRTSKLSKAECAELIDFISAWAVEHGVEFHEPETA